MNEKFKDILQLIPQKKRNQVIEALEIYNVACDKMHETYERKEK